MQNHIITVSARINKELVVPAEDREKALQIVNDLIREGGIDYLLSIFEGELYDNVVVA